MWVGGVEAVYFHYSFYYELVPDKFRPSKSLELLAVVTSQVTVATSHLSLQLTLGLKLIKYAY